MRLQETKREARTREWVRNIQDQKNSGLSIKAWCVAHGYSDGIIIGFTPEGDEYRDMHLYFTHMPMYSPPEERYLVVAGVSRFSVVSTVPAWVSAGQWVSMMITFFLNMWLIILVARLGVIREQNEDDR